jgi:hypothetical protein
MRIHRSVDLAGEVAPYIDDRSGMDPAQCMGTMKGTKVSMQSFIKQEEEGNA